MGSEALHALQVATSVVEADGVCVWGGVTGEGLHAGGCQCIVVMAHRSVLLLLVRPCYQQ